MNLTYDEYMRLKSDMPLYLATAQTTQDSFPQAENLDGVYNVAGKNKKSTPVDEKNAENASSASESGRQFSVKDVYTGSAADTDNGSGADGTIGTDMPQSETPQFKRWFRDSKVVDANGDPLEAYHGTRGHFTVFDASKSGKNLDFGTMGAGFYFTTDRENAENYAKNNSTRNGDPVVMRCFLSIKNPKEISWNEISGDNKEEATKLTEKWRAKGYDGFVAQAPNGATWWVAFRPEQVKSAADNIGTFDPGNPDIQYSLRERKHQQINPIVSNGKVRAEYQDLLDKKEYTPEHIPEWDRKAIEWITSRGGVRPAAELIAEGTAPEERHVATLVRRHLLESGIADSLPQKMREEIEYRNLSAGTDWSREGVARRLASLTLDSIDRVRALFRKLHENMPDEERTKLREDVLARTGIDVFDLPDDIVNNKHLLDRVLRAELAHKSRWYDKAYEYWINAILSAPHTHAANIIGNTSNALYELGPKRFAEAAINTIAHRKDAATFGEFREMWKALDFKTAWKNALDAFDLETLSPEGKFRDTAAVAIPGKIGRAVRTPGLTFRPSRRKPVPERAARRIRF